MKSWLVPALLAAVWSFPSSMRAAGTGADPGEIIVTAARIEQSADTTVASVTVITRDDIERLQPHSVTELLVGLPGISTSSNGDVGKISSVFVRGTDSDHVLVLIDGIKVGSATSGTTAFEQLPVEQIERIEIVRGPLSSLYGSEAIGGVIQIFTRTGAPGAPGLASFDVSGGSHATYQGEAGYSASAGAGWYNVSASGLDTNGIAACRANAPVTAGCYTTSPRQGFWSASEAVSGGYRWGDTTVSLDWLRAEGDSKYDGNVFGGNETRVTQQVFGGRVSAAPLQILSVTLAVGQSLDQSANNYNGVPAGFFDTRRTTASWLNELLPWPEQRLPTGNRTWLRATRTMPYGPATTPGSSACINGPPVPPICKPPRGTITINSSGTAPQGLWRQGIVSASRCGSPHPTARLSRRLRSTTSTTRSTATPRCAPRPRTASKSAPAGTLRRGTGRSTPIGRTSTI